MTQLTIAQSLALISSAAASWLMVCAGVAKRRFVNRSSIGCAACGRRRPRKGSCPCTSQRL